MISVQVMTARRLLWEGEVSSVIVPGDCGDYEICAYHKPVVGALRKGTIYLHGLDSKKSIKSIDIQGGVNRFDNNSLVALVELKA